MILPTLTTFAIDASLLPRNASNSTSTQTTSEILYTLDTRTFPDSELDTTAMEAFAPPSASPSHYSPEAIGFLVGAGALALVLIIMWVYIASQGGPSQMLRSFRRRREAKRKARDMEMAERDANTTGVLAQEQAERDQEEDQKAARQEALDLLNSLMANNNLVGSKLPKRPEAVDFDEEEKENKRLKQHRGERD